MIQALSTTFNLFKWRCPLLALADVFEAPDLNAVIAWPLTGPRSLASSSLFHISSIFYLVIYPLGQIYPPFILSLSAAISVTDTIATSSLLTKISLAASKLALPTLDSE